MSTWACMTLLKSTSDVVSLPQMAMTRSFEVTFGEGFCRCTPKSLRKSSRHQMIWLSAGGVRGFLPACVKNADPLRGSPVPAVGQDCCMCRQHPPAMH
jgi:hypothetical protein